ncbi:ABC transporter ATP-binding protein [Aminobacter sp. NyZ550]|jgi:branched-chain amino acid transport system ATP-binding protein|uniref:Branched-chain amino acid transport system ATP-binding protein n=1 Tax=Aminobacter ciceronei TaxID=150723 RepID=A0ABR6C3T1_9HYPH|nr:MULTISPECIES: ABC transporter ATP-binding protein [Aminobacter]WMC99282.1 ABC transporter ATP-binding protein [Aminobacter aminovorans]MBA8905866.1 branched-chain amino acid transport system ATP-binding protein [Aminobacter ciceronei]MBA9019645.1 branched-chain amino acid transport system ATP-binding protein [Aminobacter ciceronei]MRX34207.1 ATP-binding cassette domain-containing protein [Aminobacter sp. MDW-2]QNH32932.1 ABC transporter ATP-binding protein [Aminobacter sp. MDW-2]
MTPVLNVQGMVKRFGGLLATDHVDLTVKPGEIHALIGPNGAGKTTLISQLMGELRQNEGTIELDGVPITTLPTARRVSMGLARTFQITCLLPDYTVLDNVAIAVQVRQGHSFRFWGNVRHEHQLGESARGFLDAAGLGDRAGELVANLSHGEQKQLELAVALATKPRLLLLDEPMAGLGHVESQQMIEMLRGLRSQVSMLLVEHDMEAVFALADRISVLVYGRIIATGTVDEIRDNPEVRTAYLGEGDELC